MLQENWSVASMLIADGSVAGVMAGLLPSMTWYPLITG